MGQKLTIVTATLALSACGGNPPSQQEQQQEANASTPAVTTAPAAPPEKKPANDRTPLSEPHGAIDPKSTEAAGQVVQSYGALIQQNRWTEANALWGDAAAAKKVQSDLAQNAEVHLEIGNLSDPEGAAGSIYVTIPVFFYGDAKDGQPFRRAADVILRRVNDVPGSTEAQRRWHIERIDWKDAA